MTNNTFRPLYDNAKNISLGDQGNRGLEFNKFGSGWSEVTKDGTQTYEFDKGNDTKDAWLRKFASKMCGDKIQIDEAIKRQATLVNKMDGEMLRFKNTSRFITGMGLSHPVENGMTWHHSLGVPYLPGSSLKGMLRTWYRESKGDFDGEKWKESEGIETLFGSKDGVGNLILLDLLPTQPVKLDVDIMTPHYGPYYQDMSIPGDWHSPTPIKFLTVAENQTWQLAILPRPGSGLKKTDLDEIKTMMIGALEWLGAGAKTNVGYGRFDRDEKVETRIKDEAKREEADAAKVKKIAEEDAKFSPELRELVQRSRNEKWIDTEHANAFVDGMEKYLEENASPSKEVIEWVRDEMIHWWANESQHPVKWKGIWENPDATKGKKKRRKFEERPAALVRKLKAFL